MSAITVALVDDHRVVRRGLRSLIESFADLRVVGEASSAEEALEALADWQPDVLILDLLLPGGMDGIAALDQVRRVAPHTRVVVLTSYTDEARVIAALRAGAIGYVRKDADPDLLPLAIRAAARGQSMLDPAIASAVLKDLSAQPGDDLTQREREVLRELARGKTNRAIAAALVIGEETVKTHVGSILAKLHLAHRTQAALYAVRQGLAPLDAADGA